jgi:hypothetical protein
MKKNPMLAKIEAMYAQEYAKKLAQAEANYQQMLQMALQHSSDAALMAIDDVFDVNVTSAKKFHKAHMEYVDKIAHMIVVDDKDDPEIEWTKDQVDRRLMQIVGEENFRDWDERYGGNNG